MTSDTSTTLTGTELRDTFTTAAVWLERNAAAINAINVFPVPDGDTGTNMALTLRAAVEDAARAGTSVPEVAAALAHGALMGARGNSGVILSQYLRGIAQQLTAVERLDGAAIARALMTAADTARAAVSNPVEGTILTVARDAGEAAMQESEAGGSPLSVFSAAVAGARRGVARTPELLPVLREAGVVDSGGLGLAIVLEGALRHAQGEPLPLIAEDAGQIRRDWLNQMQDAHGHGQGEFGYCIEFVIKAEALAAETVRERLAPLGDSLLVVGDATALHVHLHSDDPGAALMVGTSAGRLTNVKIDNMDEQARQLSERRPRVNPEGPFSVVAVAVGAGLSETLRGAGAEIVVEGGQTMNPSTRELVAAIDAASQPRVVLLPNNKNIIWTAEQAARLTSKAVDVVPTRTIPQGIAALLAVNPEAEPEEGLAAMREAAVRVRTVEVTRSARPARIGGVMVDAHQPIALIDDELSNGGDTPDGAAITALRRVDVRPGAAITIYFGQPSSADAAESLAEQLRDTFSGVDVETLDGGQPLYDYLIAVE